jgi:3-oxoacyl-[acyl-carrier-protein] synthase I
LEEKSSILNSFENKEKVFIAQSNCVSPAGFSLSENTAALLGGKTAISLQKQNRFWHESFYAAIIEEHLIDTNFDNLALQGTFSKLEKLVLLALLPIVNQRISGDKIGFIFSTTKGNIDALSGAECEINLHKTASKIAKAAGIEAEVIVLSNACVSGLMAISVAKRLIQAGDFDHVYIVAGDIFSTFVFSGFQSFHAVSPNPCRPYSVNREGISLGEAAAATLITKQRSLAGTDSYEILGDSSINDANHISGPSRTGEGLHLSIERAVLQSGVMTSEIDMICAHGTATEYNDEMESQAFTRSKMNKTPLFSLKGFFGHTLGAAGLIETIVALEFGRNNCVPPSLGFDVLGTSHALNVSSELRNQSIDVVLKTASGFGGSNTAVIFKKLSD